MVCFINYRKKIVNDLSSGKRHSRIGSFMYLFSINYKKEAKLQFPAFQAMQILSLKIKRKINLHEKGMTI